MRTRPYTDAGLRRMPCAHCQDRKATEQWSVSVCATGNQRLWVPVCTECDIEFNRDTLAFIRHPEADALMTEYAAAKRAS